MEKRFYWLKLKEDYFNSPKIKKLRQIAGGDTYTIIYLKMQLLSIKNGGVIEFEGVEPTIEEELALKLDENVENVAITLSYLFSQNLCEENDNEYLLLEASNNIGSEGQSAERVRLFRERQEQKALHGNADVTKCNDSVTGVKRSSLSISISSSNSNSSSCNTKKEEVKEKEDKEKEKQDRKKVEEPQKRKKKPFVPPTEQEVYDYANTRGRGDLARAFYDYYTATDWYDSEGKKVVSWKGKFITWEQHNDKRNTRNSNNQGSNEYINEFLQKYDEKPQEFEI